MNTGYLTSATSLLGRLRPSDRRLVSRLLRRGMTLPPSPTELRAMSLLAHPASGVVQVVLEGDPPLVGLPPSDPDPTLDVARLRARVQDIDGWQHLGACRGIDPILAVPEVDDVGPEMAAACGGCPVRIDCLAWAVERIEQRGVLGGYPLSDRHKMRSMLLRGWSQR